MYHVYGCKWLSTAVADARESRFAAVLLVYDVTAKEGRLPFLACPHRRHAAVKERRRMTSRADHNSDHSLDELAWTPLNVAVLEILT